jgi:hypothetical protein
MSPQTGWILQDQVAPRLGASIPRNVKCVGAEDHQELVQDAIAMSAQMLERLEQSGKLGNGAGASNVAYFTIVKMRSGRRSGGSSSVDAMAVGTQYQGLSELHSLQEIVAESECGDELELHDTLSTASDDPSTITAKHLDWQMVLVGLTRLELTIVQALADGLTFRQVGRACKVSLAKVRELQQRLAQKVVEVMGLDALAIAMSRPQWKINLLTWSEQLACKGDRKAVV